jgi:hypothetical protein
VDSITISQGENECTKNTVHFTTTGPIRSGEQFELRRVTEGFPTLVTSVPAGIMRQMHDVTFLPRTNKDHRYTISSVRPGSPIVTSNHWDIRAADWTCGMPSALRTRVLHVWCPRGRDPLPLDIQGLLFDDSAGALSLANYFHEVSNGQTSLEELADVVQRPLSASAECGTTYDANIPVGAPVNRRGRWTGLPPADTRDEIHAILTEHNRDPSVGPPDRWIVIVDRSPVGGDNGVNVDGVPGAMVGGGGMYDSPRGSQNTILHELGHTYGAKHAGSIRCGDVNKPFPKGTIVDSCTTTPEDADDAVSLYGDRHDPMGNSGYHFSAFNKYLFGWIPPADVITVPMVEKRASSATVTLRDAAWAYGPRLVSIEYGTGAGPEYFFLEYRRAIGFNGPGMLSADNDVDPVSASVYIRYFPTRSLTCNGKPCLAVNSWASTYIQWRPAGSARGLIRLDTPPYWDPYRKIRVTMLSRSGRDTTLKIEHEAL